MRLNHQLMCVSTVTLLSELQAQLQVVTWGDSQQRPRVLLRGDTLPGALFNFETALKVRISQPVSTAMGAKASALCPCIPTYCW